MPNLAILPLIRSLDYYPSPSVKFMVGVSATNARGQTTAQSIATTESFCGHQSIHRDYAGTAYTNFMLSQRSVDVDTTNQVSLRTTHVSWNPVSASLQSENPPNSSTQFSGFTPTYLQQYLANPTSANMTAMTNNYGTETMANINWLLTIPTYHKVILNPWHEADGYGNSSPASTNYDWGTNFGQFRNAFRILADIIHTFNNPNWQVCMLLTAYAWKASSGTNYQPSNFFPAWSGYPATGANYVDVMGVDVYNEGSLDGSRWDSPGASFGIPMTPAERTTYNNAYPGGTNGYRTSDAGPLNWTNGFLGWCEVYGIKKWLVGEVGTQRNILNTASSWTSLFGVSNSKSDWIREFGRFAAAYNTNPFHNAKCIALEYFMSSGRLYSGSNYLTTSIHNATTGTLISGISGSATTSANLPTLTSGQAGTLYFTTSTPDKNHVWLWGGSSWSDQGVTLPESWQLWWDEDDGSWDDATSAYYAWKDVTTNYGYATG